MCLAVLPQAVPVLEHAKMRLPDRIGGFAIGHAARRKFVLSGQVKTAEELIPDRKERGEVAVLVLRQRRVVDAVHLRTGDEAGQRPHRQTQIDVGEDRPQQRGIPHQHGVTAFDVEQAHRDEDEGNAVDILHPVVAEAGRGVHVHLGVVQLVMRPEPGPGVLAAVEPVVAEVVDQQQQEELADAADPALGELDVEQGATESGYAHRHQTADQQHRQIGHHHEIDDPYQVEQDRRRRLMLLRRAEVLHGQADGAQHHDLVGPGQETLQKFQHRVLLQSAAAWATPDQSDLAGKSRGRLIPASPWSIAIFYLFKV